jgi:hypothetical protein
MAIFEDIYIDQGAQYTAEITLQKDNIDFDVTSHSFTGQVRKTVSAAAAIVTFTITQSTDSDRTNVLLVSLTATQTALLTAKRYVYDIEVESDSDSDEIYRVIQGTVHVSPNVTQ